MGLTWWSRLAAVARTASRTTAEANPIWGGCPCIKLGGVYASKGGVHVSAPVRKYSVRVCALSSFAQMPNKGEPDKH